MSSRTYAMLTFLQFLYKKHGPTDNAFIIYFIAATCLAPSHITCPHLARQAYWTTYKSHMYHLLVSLYHCAASIYNVPFPIKPPMAVTHSSNSVKHYLTLGKDSLLSPPFSAPILFCPSVFLYLLYMCSYNLHIDFALLSMNP